MVPLNIEMQTSFHSFPGNIKLMKKWVLFCKRKDKINPKTAKICSKHFLDEDFVNDLQFKMGNHNGIFFSYVI